MKIVIVNLQNHVKSCNTLESTAPDLHTGFAWWYWPAFSKLLHLDLDFFTLLPVTKYSTKHSPDASTYKKQQSDITHTAMYMYVIVCTYTISSSFIHGSDFHCSIHSYF